MKFFLLLGTFHVSFAKRSCLAMLFLACFLGSQVKADLLRISAGEPGGVDVWEIDCDPITFTSASTSNDFDFLVFEDFFSNSPAAGLPNAARGQILSGSLEITINGTTTTMAANSATGIFNGIASGIDDNDLFVNVAQAANPAGPVAIGDTIEVAFNNVRFSTLVSVDLQSNGGFFDAGFYSSAGLLTNLVSVEKAFVPTVPDPDPVTGPLDVYILGGQSNMQGVAPKSGLTVQQRRVDGASYWKNNTFSPLDVDVIGTSGNGSTPDVGLSNTFGPELGFAQALVDRGETNPVYLIKAWSGGTAIDSQWNSNTFINSPVFGAGRRNFYPGTSLSDPNIGTSYAGNVSIYQAALLQLDNANVDYEVKGVVWVQGEQDGKSELTAGRYGENLASFIGRLYEDLSLADDVPFVYAQTFGVVPDVPGTTDYINFQRFSAFETLMESQANADADSGHLISISNAHIVSTENLMLQDHVHFDAPSTIALGERLATELFTVPTVLGDFNLDGVVDCADLDGYVGNIGMAATGALAALDIDGNGMLDASDADTHIRTLIETSNGVVGTFPGDLNCDGQVNVLGDAFALVSNLGNTVTSYSSGDLNFDGTVNVLGDAFALISNLGNSNAP